MGWWVGGGSGGGGGGGGGAGGGGDGGGVGVVAVVAAVAAAVAAAVVAWAELPTLLLLGTVNGNIICTSANEGSGPSAVETKVIATVLRSKAKAKPNASRPKTKSYTESKTMP